MKLKLKLISGKEHQELVREMIVKLKLKTINCFTINDNVIKMNINFDDFILIHDIICKNYEFEKMSFKNEGEIENFDKEGISIAGTLNNYVEICSNEKEENIKIEKSEELFEINSENKNQTKSLDTANISEFNSFNNYCQFLISTYHIEEEYQKIFEDIIKSISNLTKIKIGWKNLSKEISKEISFETKAYFNDTFRNYGIKFLDFLKSKHSNIKYIINSISEDHENLQVEENTTTDEDLFSDSYENLEVKENTLIPILSPNFFNLDGIDFEKKSDILIEDILRNTFEINESNEEKFLNVLKICNISIQLHTTNIDEILTSVYYSTKTDLFDLRMELSTFINSRTEVQNISLNEFLSQLYYIS